MIVQFLAGLEARPVECETSWGDLVGVLTGVKRDARPKKELPGWCPARLSEPRRLKKNVLDIGVLVFDYDDITVQEWDRARRNLEGFAWCYHSTYTHQPISGRLRYRVIVQLDKPVPGDKWKRFYSTIADELGAAYDDSCTSLERFFYGPHCPADGPEPEAGSFAGIPIDTEAVLQHLVSAPRIQTITSAVTREDIEGIIPKTARRIENPRIRQGYAGILAALQGEPFAAGGERDNTLLAMSGILAKAFPKHSAEAIVAPLAAALDIDDPEPGWAPAALIAKLERDLEKNREEHTKVDDVLLAQLGREGSYTGEEADSYVRLLRLSSREALARQLILEHRGDYFVFYEGKYLFLGTKERAENAVLKRLAVTTAALPVTLGEDTAKGYVSKSLKRLLNDYGRSIDRVVKDLRLQQSYVEKDTLHFAVCPRDPTLQPAYSPGVEMWLARSSEPALIDWCATAAKLDLPTACLVLDGAPRTGKSQLAEALAAIWGHRYTPMHTLHAAFNDSLARCPVVYAEETIPWEFRRDTGMLKQLVTARDHQLREKYQSSADLIGAVRVILARNDHKLFEAGEALTDSSVKALSDRILYVNMGDIPAPHFPAREIAQHILWLEHNHTPAPSARPGMWVCGKPSRLHNRMRAFTSKVSVGVCEWLLGFIENPTISGDTSMREFKLDSQGLKITPRLVYSKWQQYCANDRQPTRAQVSDALAGMSTRVGGFYSVDLDVLAEYADSVLAPFQTRTALQSAIESAGHKAAKAVN